MTAAPASQPRGSLGAPGPPSSRSGPRRARGRRGGSARPGTPDVGAAALLTLLVAGTALALALATTSAALRVVVDLAAARTAADATALAVLSGSPLAGGAGAPDTAVGAEVARRNGARLVEIDVAGWPRAVAVTVAVELPDVWPLADRSLDLRAAARAVPPPSTSPSSASPSSASPPSASPSGRR